MVANVYISGPSIPLRLNVLTFQIEPTCSHYLADSLGSKPVGPMCLHSGKDLLGDWLNLESRLESEGDFSQWK